MGTEPSYKQLFSPLTKCQGFVSYLQSYNLTNNCHHLVGEFNYPRRVSSHQGMLSSNMFPFVPVPLSKFES